MQAVIQDYEAGADLVDFDPTAPEEIKREFMNKLAKTLVLVQEVLQQGEYEVSSDAFFEKRGEVLDKLDDPEIADWLSWMQRQNRCPFRRFPVR